MTRNNIIIIFETIFLFLIIILIFDIRDNFFLFCKERKKIISRKNKNLINETKFNLKKIYIKL